MTVVVGFVGTDGAVMASDSEATEGGHTRYEVEKCWTCGSLMMGYTGSGSVKQPLQVRLAKQVGDAFGDAPLVERWKAQAAIKQAIAEVLKYCYQGFVETGGGQAELVRTLAGALLVIGRDENGFWLLEIDHNNTATFYDEHGFHTVGSGSAAAYVAHGLMKHYDIGGRGLSHLKLVAYRTVDTCINVLGGSLGVGGNVQLWHATNDAPFTRADEEESAQLASGVEKWTTIERESLDQVVLDEGVPPAEGIAMPEPLDEQAAAEENESPGADAA